jgi:hypothetical protein
MPYMWPSCVATEGLPVLAQPHAASSTRPFCTKRGAPTQRFQLTVSPPSPSPPPPCGRSPQEIAFDAKRPDPKQVHVLSSGLKAAATWTRVEVLQVKDGGGGVSAGARWGVGVWGLGRGVECGWRCCR